MSGSEQLVLIDGSGYIFRAFHALPPMTRGDGTPVNAVYGFTGMVMKLVDDLAPAHVAVVFDSARKTFRNDIYADYKANRTDPPEELVPQFDLVREATTALSLPQLEVPGFEADDLIATYAALGEAAGMETVIVSSDKDLMQLVRGGVTMLDPMKQRRIAGPEVEERFGVPPDKVVDVQALAGDSTDNVPGVPGIGVKTAAELINTYGDLDTLLASAGEIKQPKRRENLINFAEQARISRDLVRLRDDAPMPLPLEELKRTERDMDRLIAFLKAQDFKRLLTRVGAPAEAAEPAVRSMGGTPQPAAGASAPASAPLPEGEVSYELVTSIAKLEEWAAAARKQGYLAVDTETSSLNAAAAEMVGVSMALAPGAPAMCRFAMAAPLSRRTGRGLALDAPPANYDQVGFDDAIAVLKPCSRTRRS
ncbi:MAG: hypothetical protein CM15mP115_24080 [Alphaproteobacteria bacterium]|nr:MAG: hypothetical protein CM15mP115_24080 [Alphaproteobacteria bacterium]